MAAESWAATGFALLPGLRQYLTRFEQHYGVRVDLMAPPEWTADALEPTVEAQMMRIIQEALSNVRRHAQAQSVHVRLDVQDGHARVVVADDGAEFDPDQHRVIVPDLRGHGRSRGLGPPYTAAQLASDLVRVLDQLGIGSTAVLGYSQGGAIAQQLALDYQERCNRLVLGCTFAFNGVTLSERIEGHLTPYVIQLLGMRRLAKLSVSQGLKQPGKERGDWLAGFIENQDPKLMVAARRHRRR